LSLDFSKDFSAFLSLRADCSRRKKTLSLDFSKKQQKKKERKKKNSKPTGCCDDATPRESREARSTGGVALVGGDW
jgi:hypothetical protein